MAGPTISITAPTSGSTVAQTFTASGTYTSPTTPTINVELRDANGVTVATGITTAGRGTWSSLIVASQAYTGASVYAEIVGTTASATVGNITVI